MYPETAALFHEPALCLGNLEITVRCWCTKEGHQTKCELLVIRAVLVPEHFHVSRATALTFRNTHITIDYAKRPVFWVVGVYLCWQSEECFSDLQIVACFWIQSEMDSSVIFFSCWAPSFVTAKAEQLSIIPVIVQHVFKMWHNLIMYCTQRWAYWQVAAAHRFSVKVKR